MRVKKITCPCCGEMVAQRVRRAGPVEDLLSLIYIYPFGCQLCAHRFRVMQWGTRYYRAPADRPQYKCLPVRFPVSFSSEQTEDTGVATHLSVSSCSVVTKASLKEGSLLCVRLRIPGEDRAITVETAVVLTVRFGRIGLGFLRLAPPDKDRLIRLVLSLWKTPGQSTPSRSPALSDSRRPGTGTRSA